jgi:hypothetical protein
MVSKWLSHSTLDPSCSLSGSGYPGAVRNAARGDLAIAMVQ